MAKNLSSMVSVVSRDWLSSWGITITNDLPVNKEMLYSVTSYIHTYQLVKFVKKERERETKKKKSMLLVDN